MNVFIFFSEVPPEFCFRQNLVQTGRRTKWTCSFLLPRCRLNSVFDKI